MKLSELQAIKKQYTEAIKENGEELLKEEFRIFFEQAPEVLSVKWRQYTPYFSDGDPCIFNADEFSITIEEANEDSEGYGDYEDNYLSLYDFTKDIEWQEEIVKNMDSFLKDRIIKALDNLVENAHDNNLLESVFGDHVKIIATRSGFEVDEYSHD